MANYIVPKWRYEYGKTGKGLNQKLLSPEELSNSHDVLLEWIRGTNAINKPEWYKPIVKTKSYEKVWLDCNRRIKKLIKKSCSSIPYHELDALNEEINRIFSDEGWRQIKKKIRQQTIRQQRNQVILTKHTAKRLADFKATLKLDTFDEAIEYLLCEYDDKLAESMDD